MFSAYGNFTTPPMFDSSAVSRLPAMGLAEKAAFGTNNVTRLH
jgi:hypothetical protein